MQNCSKRLGTVLAFACLVAVGTASRAPAERGSAQYSFVESDSEPVLTLTIGAGLSGVATRLTAYGSGAAEVETIWGGKVIERVDKIIQNAEMEEMLGLIAFGGLLDSDEESIVQEMDRLREDPTRHPMAPADSPMFVVKFAIERTDSTSAKVETIRRSVQFQAPAVMAARFPTIKALQALSKLQAKMSAIAGLSGGAK